MLHLKFSLLLLRILQTKYFLADPCQSRKKYLSADDLNFLFLEQINMLNVTVCRTCAG